MPNIGAFQDSNKEPQQSISQMVHLQEEFCQPPPSKKARICYNGFPPPNSQQNYIPTAAVPSRIPTQNIQSPTYFKTKLCDKFRSGYCPYGNKCTYAHGPDELRRPPNHWKNNVVEENLKNMRATDNMMMDNSSEMKHSLDGNDNGFDQQTKLWKTKHCFAFQRTGHCHFGNNCRYAHGFAERRQVEDHTESVRVNDGVTPPKSPPQPFLNASSFMPQPAPEEQEEKEVEFLRRKLFKLKDIYADWIDDGSSLSPESLNTEA